MKQLYIVLLAIGFTPTIKGMDTPQSALSIVGQRTGDIDKSCTTTADLMRDRTSLGRIVYTLEGIKQHRPAICYGGWMAYQNNPFLARIKSLTMTDPESSSSIALVAFTIKNLKELHEKQNKKDINNHALYIDAIVNPKNSEFFIYEALGFKKVGSLQKISEQHIYFLDPRAEILPVVSSICQRLLTTITSVSIEEKPEQQLVESSDEENPHKKLLAEIDARNAEASRKLLDDKSAQSRAAQPRDSKRLAPPGVAVTPSSALPTPIPAAVATSTFPRAIRTAGVTPKIRKSPRTPKPHKKYHE